MYDRERENEKYSWLYENGYGAGPVKPAFDGVRDRLGDTSQLSVVDVGCGHAVLADVTQWGTYTGTELATRQLERLRMKRSGESVSLQQADATHLPFEDDQFDLSWCCDVLEHLPPAYVSRALHEVCRVGKMTVVGVCCRPSGILSREGENLHLTVRDEDWWYRRVSQFGVVEVKKSFDENVVFFIREKHRSVLFPASLAVVGNGPAEVGLKLGTTIDAFGKVARFNNYDVSEEEYTRDYGARTDCWVTSFWHNVRAREELLESVFCPFPITSKQEHLRKRYTYNEELLRRYEEQTTIVSENVFERLQSRCGDPSTGIAFLHWLYEERGFLDPEATFGFSFFAGDRHHYCDDEKKRDGHSGTREQQLYHDMLTGGV